MVHKHWEVRVPNDVLNCLPNCLLNWVSNWVNRADAFFAPAV